MPAQRDKARQAARIMLPTRLGEIDLDDLVDPARSWPQKHDPLRQQDRLVDVMGDEDHGHPPLRPHLQKSGPQRFAGHGVEGGEGFVHQQDLGFDRQRAGKADALLHPARQFVRIGIGKFPEPDQTQQRQRPFGPGAARQAPQRQHELDVACHGPPRQQPRRLKHHRQVRTWHRGAALHQNLAPVRRDQTVHQPQKRRLAAAARPDQADEFARRNIEGNAVERLNPALPEGFADLSQRDQRHGGLLHRHRASVRVWRQRPKRRSARRRATVISVPSAIITITTAK